LLSILEYKERRKRLTVIYIQT